MDLKKSINCQLSIFRSAMLMKNVSLNIKHGATMNASLQVRGLSVRTTLKFCLGKAEIDI